MYRVGWPFWKAVARSGRPVRFRVDVHYDPEVNVYWASSNDIDGLVVEGKTLDELAFEIRTASELLLELALGSPAAHVSPDMRMLGFAPL